MRPLTEFALEKKVFPTPVAMIKDAELNLTVLSLSLIWWNGVWSTRQAFIYLTSWIENPTVWEDGKKGKSTIRYNLKLQA